MNLSFRKAMEFGFSTYRTIFKYLITIFAVMGIAIGIPLFALMGKTLVSYFNTEVECSDSLVCFIPSIIYMIFYLWLTIRSIIISCKVYDNKAIEWKDFFKIDSKKILKSLVATLILALIVILPMIYFGILFYFINNEMLIIIFTEIQKMNLIVIGIVLLLLFCAGLSLFLIAYFIARYIFINYAIADQDVSIIESFKQSSYLTNGFRARLLLVMSLISIGFSRVPIIMDRIILPSILSLFFTAQNESLFIYKFLYLSLFIVIIGIYLLSRISLSIFPFLAGTYLYKELKNYKKCKDASEFNLNDLKVPSNTFDEDNQ